VKLSEIRNPDFPEKLSDDSNLTKADRRNLVDFYKYWETEAIKADLDKNRHQFAVVLENFATDFNIASAIRNCNAFLAAEVFICGQKHWDPRGAVGTHKYQHVHNYSTWEELQPVLEEKGYHPIVIDNLDGAANIYNFEWPEKTAMIFGAESVGVSNRALEIAESVVFIPQYGSTRSINVASAQAIAGYDYLTKLYA
jgi:tRNA G18 (ribose-2'-O)-methylase SpoU